MTRESKDGATAGFWAALGGFLAVAVTMAGIGFTFGDRIWIPRDAFEERMYAMQTKLVELQIAITRLEEKLSHPPTSPANRIGRRSK